MKRLVLKVALLLAPMALFYGPALCVLAYTGELMNLDAVIELQDRTDKPVLYGLGAWTSRPSYKLRATVLHDPEILVLGTSRTNQFRRQFFDPGRAFYNANGAVSNVYHWRQFLRNLPENRRLRLIVLGVDQWELNPRWGVEEAHTWGDEGKMKANPFFASPRPGLLHLTQSSWQTIYTRLLRQHREGMPLLPDWQRDGVQRIGIQAVYTSQGYRSDGSYRYPNPVYQKSSFEASYVKIDEGNEFFAHGDAVSPQRIAEIDAFLAECRRRRIHVVGFLPPFAPSVQQRMVEAGERYRYLERVYPAVAEVFVHNGLHLRDFTDATALGSPDEEFLDGYHGSEKTHVRMLLALARDEPRLRAVMDVEALSRLITDNPDRISYFGD